MLNLILGDCLEEMRKIPSASIDLIVTDPPYTMTKRGKSCRPNWMPSNMGDNVFNGDIPDVKAWMGECYRVLKDGTHFYTFCNTNDILRYLESAKEVGFKMHNIITMIKDTGMPNRWYLKNCELVLFFRKGKAKKINNCGTSDIIDIPNKKTKGEDGKNLHDTEKPVELMKILIENSSQEGDLVFDPFIGIGATAIACKKTNRHCLGCELDEEYYNITLQRLEG